MLNVLRQRNVALLWFAGLISLTGDWVLSIGLPIYVYQLSGSTLATSMMFAARIVPRLLLGSLAGVFVDRWSRKRTMVIVDVLLAIGLLPLFAVRSIEWLWVVYLIAFVQSCLSQFFGPAENALLPQLVEEQDLLPANALNSLNNNLARLIGPSIGGLVAAWGGLPAIAAVDAVSFLASALLIGLLRVSEPRRTQAEARLPWRSVWDELVAGLRVVRHSRALTTIFGLLAITGLGEGVFGVLIVAFVSTVLGGGALELGWLMAAQAVGGLFGGLFVGMVARRVPTVRLVGLGSIAFGLIDLAIFNYPALQLSFMPAIWIGIALFVLVGIPGVWTQSAIQTLIQSNVPDGFLGRVFGALGTTMGVLGLAGTLIAGIAGDRLGIVPVLNIQGAGYVLAGLLALVLLRDTLSASRSASADAASASHS
jgi:MFS family permease